MRPQPKTRAEALAQALCDFTADRSDDCEDCRRKLLRGERVYWFSDGDHFESRDGRYVCSECATKDIEADTRFRDEIEVAQDGFPKQADGER